MPLLDDGIYIQDDNYNFEITATYQLKYLVETALLSLDSIDSPENVMVKKFVNTAQYYRFYLDHLFYCFGQINDRFVLKRVKDEQVQMIKSEHIKINRTNYRFTEEQFEILSKKLPRNIIEHLDERNLATIKERFAVGGFNVISENSDPEMIESINIFPECYPYTLNLIHKTVIFYDIQQKQSYKKKFIIALLQLRNELEELKENIEKFDQILHDNWF